MKIILINILIFVSPLATFAQWCLNDTKSDSIFIGLENKLILEYVDCTKVVVKSKGTLKIRKEDCCLLLTPTKRSAHQMLIFIEEQVVDTIMLYSTIATVKHALNVSSGLILNKEAIGINIANNILGLRPITNVPWLIDACTIKSYDFIIVRNNETIHYSKNIGTLLSRLNLNALSRIRQGDIVKFENIFQNCPGDSQHKYLEKIVKIY